MNVQRLPFLLASLLVAACGPVVVDGGTNNAAHQGGGGSGQSSSSGVAPGDDDVPAVAMTRAQSDVLWEEYWSTHDPSGGSSSTGGDTLNPNDLFLRLSDRGASCDSPTAGFACGVHWEMTLVLPPALQAVGVYDLEDPALVAYSYMSETGAPNSPAPDDCPWAGGSPGPGTLEILAIDETEVHFKVQFASGGLWETDPSGDYTAPRCP